MNWMVRAAKRVGVADKLNMFIYAFYSYFDGRLSRSSDCIVLGFKSHDQSWLASNVFEDLSLFHDLSRQTGRPKGNTQCASGANYENPESTTVF